MCGTKTPQMVRTNFKDYIEADGNGVTEAFITMDTDKDAVKVKEFADKMSSAIAADTIQMGAAGSVQPVKVRRKRRSEIFQWADIFC